MAKTLRVPNESRFVKAFALTVDPGDTLSLLLEVGALGNRDLTIVRRTREALDPAYDRASDVKDWELAHTVGVLRQAGRAGFGGLPGLRGPGQPPGLARGDRIRRGSGRRRLRQR